jgi:hypothetical protein
VGAEGGGVDPRVLEQQDRTAAPDHRLRPAQDAQLGPLDVDLDELHGLLADEVVESADLDVELDSPLAGHRGLLVEPGPRRCAGDVEERGRAVLVGERTLVDRDIRESPTQVLGEVGQWLDGVVRAAGAASTHQAVISPAWAPSSTAASSPLIVRRTMSSIATVSRVIRDRHASSRLMSAGRMPARRFHCARHGPRG